MQIRWNCVFIVSLVVGASLCLSVSAQDKKSKTAAADSAGLIIGTVAGELGTTVAIPLYYQPPKNSRVKKLHAELDYVSNSVKFDKAEKGVASSVEDFDVKVETKDLPPDDKKITHTRITVDVTLLSSDPKKSLPDGLLAFLNFKIPNDAKPFSIGVNPIQISGEDTANKPVVANAEAGKIIVSVPDAPLAGCFFFSH